MHTTLKTPAVLLLLVACEGTIQTNPNTLSLEPTAVSDLRGAHTAALMNAYKTETEAIILQKSGSTAKTDLKHLTNTAIVMLSRAMKQQGIHEPERAARYLADHGYETRYPIGLEVMKSLTYDRWRKADPEDTLRFHACAFTKWA